MKPREWTTPGEVARAVDESLSQGELELFDNSVSWTNENKVTLTLESGEIFAITVTRRLCAHPSCSENATEMVRGEPLCETHASEFRVWP